MEKYRQPALTPLERIAAAGAFLLAPVAIAPVTVIAEAPPAQASGEPAYIPEEQDNLPGNQLISRKPSPLK